MPDHMTDAELVLLALLRGVITWAPSASSSSSGTLTLNKVGYWTNCDERGLPKISLNFRRELIETIHPLK